MDDTPILIKVGIFGTGNIGTDLIAKLLKRNDVSIPFVVGRRDDSPGIKLAQQAGVPVFISGIPGLREALATYQVDWVADTSSAATHVSVREAVLQKAGVRLLDFTPSPLSQQYCPGSLESIPEASDIGLISCGGQSSIPVIALLKERWGIESVELTSTLASRSVGPATRANLDEYISKTENAIRHYSGADRVKVILIINPANPPIEMRVSLYIKFEDSVNTDEIDVVLSANQDRLRGFIPNFALIGKTVKAADHALISFHVTGMGDFLPPYAGNLDILTHTAVKIFLDSARRTYDLA